MTLIRTTNINCLCLLPTQRPVSALVTTSCNSHCCSPRPTAHPPNQPPICCGCGSGWVKFKWAAFKDSFQLCGSVRPVGVSVNLTLKRPHEGLVSLKASCRFCMYLSINCHLKQRHMHVGPNKGFSCVSEAWGEIPLLVNLSYFGKTSAEHGGHLKCTAFVSFMRKAYCACKDFKREKSHARMKVCNAWKKNAYRHISVKCIFCVLVVFVSLHKAETIVTLQLHTKISACMLCVKK